MKGDEGVNYGVTHRILILVAESARQQTALGL